MSKSKKTPSYPEARRLVKKDANEQQWRDDLLLICFGDQSSLEGRRKRGRGRYVGEKSTEWKSMEKHRDAIQIAGDDYRCHTCLTDIRADRKQHARLPAIGSNPLSSANFLELSFLIAAERLDRKASQAIASDTDCKSNLSRGVGDRRVIEQGRMAFE
jgi:hypothetical protein